MYGGPGGHWKGYFWKLQSFQNCYDYTETGWSTQAIDRDFWRSEYLSNIKSKDKLIYFYTYIYIYTHTHTHIPYFKNLSFWEINWQDSILIILVKIRENQFHKNMYKYMYKNL